jgi:phosphinothricin acetyltransferase
MKEIFNAEVAWATTTWEWSPLSNEDWQVWFDAHTRDNHVLLVAEVLGQIAGFAGYGTFRNKAGYVTTVEDSVYLREQFRRHGLGKALLRELMVQARARGIHAMVAAVTGENQASLAAHTSVGFVEVGRLPQVGHKFGRWLDLVLLQVLLDDKPSPIDLSG